MQLKEMFHTIGKNCGVFYPYRARPHLSSLAPSLLIARNTETGRENIKNEFKDDVIEREQPKTAIQARVDEPGAGRFLVHSSCLLLYVTLISDVVAAQSQ